MGITAIGSSINTMAYKICSINTCTKEIAANKSNADKVSISDEALKANFSRFRILWIMLEGMKSQLWKIYGAFGTKI
ncbi:MAG: hypothetical protein PVG39_19995 [Desulfobacteraceae bacterium]|jgi:hypothetical protein